MLILEWSTIRAYDSGGYLEEFETDVFYVGLGYTPAADRSGCPLYRPMVS